MIGVRSDQLAATEDQVVGYAQAVVSDQASAVGVAAIPTPVTDSDSDLFFVYERLMSDITFSSASGFTRQGTYREFDSRAMRKVEDGDDIISVVESGIAASTQGLRVKTFFRRLVKLH